MAHRRIRSYEQDGIKVRLGGMTWREVEEREAERRKMVDAKATDDQWLAFTMRMIYNALVWGGEFPKKGEDHSDEHIIAAIKEEFSPASFIWLQDSCFDVNQMKRGEVKAESTTDQPTSANSAVA